MSTLCMWLLFSLCHVQSLWPHELQDARLPCPSLSPRVCSNSCLVSQWCHSAIHSSVARFLPAFNLSIKVLPHRSAFSFHSLWHICKLCTHIHVYFTNFWKRISTENLKLVQNFISQICLHMRSSANES